MREREKNIIYIRFARAVFMWITDQNFSVQSYNVPPKKKKKNHVNINILKKHVDTTNIFCLCLYAGYFCLYKNQ